MMNVFTLVGLALLGTSAAVLLKMHNKEGAVLFGAAFSIVLLTLALEPLKTVTASLFDTAEKYSLDGSYVKLMVKMIGISYLVRFASDICTDSGETAMANKVELLGRIMLTVLYIPVIVKILDAAAELMGI